MENIETEPISVMWNPIERTFTIQKGQTVEQYVITPHEKETSLETEFVNVITEILRRYSMVLEFPVILRSE